MANTFWCGSTDDKLYLQSGQFSSTMKTSLDVNGVDIQPNGISWDGVNTPWAGREEGKLYLQSGQFSSTMKTSLSIAAVDSAVSGISYDGTNTPWCGDQADKLYLQSGQFSSTMKTSLAVTAIELQLQGIEHGDFDQRVPSSGWSHKMDGVASPGKVSGVANASIGKVMGVSV